MRNRAHHRAGRLRAEYVEHSVAEPRFGEMEVTTLYNPFFAITDNLATCWIASVAMTDDFILLNGDTVFEDGVLRRVLDAPREPIAVTIDRKPDYDADDMKVTLDTDGRLTAIGKKLPLHTVDGESIGMLRFCENRRADVPRCPESRNAPTGVVAQLVSLRRERTRPERLRSKPYRSKGSGGRKSIRPKTSTACADTSCKTATARAPQGRRTDRSVSARGRWAKSDRTSASQPRGEAALAICRGE